MSTENIISSLNINGNEYKIADSECRATLASLIAAPQYKIDEDTREWQKSEDGGNTWESIEIKATGDSAYEIYKSEHPEYTGSVNDWLVSLKGDSGITPSFRVDDTGNFYVQYGEDDEELLVCIKGDTIISDGISSAEIDTDGQLIVTYSNNENKKLGNVIGPQGDPGYGVSKFIVDENENLNVTFAQADIEYVQKSTVSETIDDSTATINIPTVGAIKSFVSRQHGNFIESSVCPGCFYRISNNGMLEWQNSPMAQGVEYLTTERYNGKPVWVKLVELGTPPTLSEGESESKNFRAISAGEIYDAYIWLSNGAGSIQQFPYIQSGKLCAKARVADGTHINLTVYQDIATSAGDTEYKAHALVKFTRDSQYVAPPTAEWERRMLTRIDQAMLPQEALRPIRRAGGGVIANGTLLTGINYSPVYKTTEDDGYSSTKDRMVGTGTKLSTYYSALENPASIMYEEYPVAHSNSSRSTYYGINCSGFVSYALGLKLYTTTDMKNKLDYHSDWKEVETTLVDHLSNIRRGDVLINTLRTSGYSDHVMLVKDVVYDKSGDLTGFILADSWKPFVRVSYYTISQLYGLLSPVDGTDAYEKLMEDWTDAANEDKNAVLAEQGQPYRVIRIPLSEQYEDDGTTVKRPVETIKYSKSIYPNKGDGGIYYSDIPLKFYERTDDGNYKEHERTDNIVLYIPNLDDCTHLKVKPKSRPNDKVFYYSVKALKADYEKTINGVTVYELPYSDYNFDSETEPSVKGFIFPKNRTDEYTYEILKTTKISEGNWIDSKDSCTVILRKDSITTN
jgi:hypothetical protein